VGGMPGASSVGGRAGGWGGGGACACGVQGEGGVRRAQQGRAGQGPWAAQRGLPAHLVVGGGLCRDVLHVAVGGALGVGGAGVQRNALLDDDVIAAGGAGGGGVQGGGLPAAGGAGAGWRGAAVVGASGGGGGVDARGGRGLASREEAAGTPEATPNDADARLRAGGWGRRGGAGGGAGKITQGRPTRLGRQHRPQGAACRTFTARAGR
jgi:hypothetical protein